MGKIISVNDIFFIFFYSNWMKEEEEKKKTFKIGAIFMYNNKENARDILYNLICVCFSF